MSTIKLPAASGGGSISIKGPSSLGSDRDLVDTSGHINLLDSENLKIGTGADLKVYHNGTRSYINNSTGELFLEGNNGEIALIKGTYASGEWMLRAIPDGAVECYWNGTKRLETTADGVTVTGHVKMAGSGHGIDFSAASGSAAGSDSALLDDYEEGNFAPVITGQTSAGSGTYSTNDGWYTKVGRLVNYWFYISWDNHDGTGNMQVTLPFACSNNSGGTMNATGSIMLHNIDLSANTVGLAAYTWHGSSVFQIYEMHDNAGWAPTAVDSGGGMIGSLSYMAA